MRIFRLLWRKPYSLSWRFVPDTNASHYGHLTTMVSQGLPRWARVGPDAIQTDGNRSTDECEDDSRHGQPLCNSSPMAYVPDYPVLGSILAIFGEYEYRTNGMILELDPQMFFLSFIVKLWQAWHHPSKTVLACCKALYCLSTQINRSSASRLWIYDTIKLSRMGPGSPGPLAEEVLPSLSRHMTMETGNDISHPMRGAAHAIGIKRCGKKTSVYHPVANSCQAWTPFTLPSPSFPSRSLFPGCISSMRSSLVDAFLCHQVLGDGLSSATCSISLITTGGSNLRNGGRNTVLSPLLASQ